MLAELQMHDFPFAESEGTMAVSEKEFRELAISVAGIKGERRAWKFIPGAAIIVGVAALSWCWKINNKITAIEQQLADGGSAKLVAELRNPKSPQQLKANLTTVSAQIQTARVEGKQPNQNKVEALSTALVLTVKNNPDLPEAWQAAVQLIDYKFQAATPELQSRNCLDTLPPGSAEVDRLSTPNGAVDYPEFSGPQVPGWMTHVALGHCTLNLDDDGSFYSTGVGKFFERVKAHHPQVSIFVLVLNDARIVYSGGKIIPITGIEFTRCSFAFKPPEMLPNPPARSITTQLLAANPSSGTISMPSGI